MGEKRRPGRFSPALGQSAKGEQCAPSGGDRGGTLPAKPVSFNAQKSLGSGL